MDFLCSTKSTLLRVLTFAVQQVQVGSFRLKTSYPRRDQLQIISHLPSCQSQPPNIQKLRWKVFDILTKSSPCASAFTSCGARFTTTNTPKATTSILRTEGTPNNHTYLRYCFLSNGPTFCHLNVDQLSFVIHTQPIQLAGCSALALWGLGLALMPIDSAAPA
jgi:hypothetical protein